MVGSHNRQKTVIIKSKGTSSVCIFRKIDKWRRFGIIILFKYFEKSGLSLLGI